MAYEQNGQQPWIAQPVPIEGWNRVPEHISDWGWAGAQYNPYSAGDQLRNNPASGQFRTGGYNQRPRSAREAYMQNQPYYRNAKQEYLNRSEQQPIYGVPQTARGSMPGSGFPAEGPMKLPFRPPEYGQQVARNQQLENAARQREMRRRQLEAQRMYGPGGMSGAYNRLPVPAARDPGQYGQQISPNQQLAIENAMRQREQQKMMEARQLEAQQAGRPLGYAVSNTEYPGVGLRPSRY